MRVSTCDYSLVYRKGASLFFMIFVPSGKSNRKAESNGNNKVKKTNTPKSNTITKILMKQYQ